MGENYASLDGVKKWFTKHGYPLELQTARHFQTGGFDVAHSSFYKDPETGKLREIDVVASRDLPGGKWWIRVTFVVECKAGQNQSWVLLGSPTAPVDGIGRLTVGIRSKRAGTLGPYLRRRSPVGTVDLWKRSQRPARGLVRVGNGNEDVAYAAITTLVKAATAQLAFAETLEETGEQVAEFVFPVLVVDAPLYRISLDVAGEVAFEEIPAGTVSWRHPSSNRHLTVIDIVTLADLPAFVREASECAVQILEHATRGVDLLDTVEED